MRIFSEVNKNYNFTFKTCIQIILLHYHKFIGFCLSYSLTPSKYFCVTFLSSFLYLFIYLFIATRSAENGLWWKKFLLFFLCSVVKSQSENSSPSSALSHKIRKPVKIFSWWLFTVGIVFVLLKFIINFIPLSYEASQQ